MNLKPKYLVPKIGVCMHDLMGKCKFKKCVYEHYELGHSIKDYIEIKQDEQCLICHGNIMQDDQLFGIIDSCSHAFCIKHIEEWTLKRRKIHQNPTCPACRNNYYTVIPGYFIPSNEAERKKLLELYKKIAKFRLCQNEKGNKGL